MQGHRGNQRQNRAVHVARCLLAVVTALLTSLLVPRVAFAESRFRVWAEWPGCDGQDPWESPHAAEHAGNVGPGSTNGPLGKRGKPKPELVFPNRVASESFSYDGLGNRVSSDDDQHGFYDRSLGTESHASPGKPYQLTSASC
jgi:hypothetical protein